MPRKPAAPAEPVERVTNHIAGTRLHLGDGRVLAHGESAEVTQELAVFLRKRGQAE